VAARRDRNGRTLTFVDKLEAEGVEIARRHVAPDASIFAVKPTHWDDLDTAL
jgi:predicted HD phosphohydrolase